MEKRWEKIVCHHHPRIYIFCVLKVASVRTVAEAKQAEWSNKEREREKWGREKARNPCCVATKLMKSIYFHSRNSIFSALLVSRLLWSYRKSRDISCFTRWFRVECASSFSQSWIRFNFSFFLTRQNLFISEAWWSRKKLLCH